MFVGYVSDENYSALAEVAVEFERDEKFVAATHSTASGAIYAEISAGKYRVTLGKSGFGAKRIFAEIKNGQPINFRLLSDSLYGYAWPKWVQSGRQAEFRVHAGEPYSISLW